MQQLEIQYFFPLTEQIPLDLDFKPCHDYAEEKRKAQLVNSVTYTGDFSINGNVGIGTINTTSVYQFQSSSMGIGYWSISNGSVQIWRETRPNWLHQKMTKVFFGWEWKDK